MVVIARDPCAENVLLAWAERLSMASGPRSPIVAPPVLRPSPHKPLTLPTSLRDRYRQALEAQERLMRSRQTP